MGKVLIVGALLAVAIGALSQPWIGVSAAYLVSILTPQAVWWWNFGDLRPAFYILLPTLLGFVVAMISGRINFATARNGRFACLLIFWLCLALSYWFGAYAHAESRYRFTDPDWAFSTFNKVLLLCVVACLCVDEVRKLRVLCVVFVVSAVYLVYWANAQYLAGSVFGRLAGPVDIYGIGTYSDENSFGMLFVVATPFLWFAGQVFSTRLIKWGIWSVIPFGWHAVFLTASRAALLGIGVVTALLAIRSKNKLIGLLLIPAFIGAYVWQAGDLMKERAGTISDKSEASSASRLQAWSAALGMIGDHPLVGVGMASFGPAFPDYSTHKPREAHNTPLQISAESGVIAGAMYITIILSSVTALWRQGRRFRRMQLGENERQLYLINEAVLVSVCGLVVCSMFASLQMYEIFYFLFVLTNAVIFVGNRRLTELEAIGGSLAQTEGTRAHGYRRRVPVRHNAYKSSPPVN